MTVHEYLNKHCSVTLFHELAEDNEYWKGALKFYIDNKHYKVDQLTPKQLNWLDKIVESLVEEAAK